MLNAPVMEANDAVSGSMAECYVTIDGNRYNMMQLYSFESSAKVNSQDVKILGRTGIGKKPTGWSGSWKGTAHFNQSVFRRWFVLVRRPSDHHAHRLPDRQLDSGEVRCRRQSA